MFSFFPANYCFFVNFQDRASRYHIVAVESQNLQLKEEKLPWIKDQK